MDEAIKYAAIPDQYNEKYVESGVLTEGSSAEASAYVGKMDEAVKAAAVPNQQNEASVEDDLLNEGSSGADY